MKWYCEKCNVIHGEDELCPRIKEQLKREPQLLVEAANFTTIAAQETLITSQALEGLAKGVNQIAGTKLSYEGTQQFARDIQVFKRLNEEAFVRSGVFANPESAQQYLNNATAGQMKNLVAKINGSGQEVDWVRFEQGKLSSLFQKSELLNKNAVGVDGVTYNRFTGNEITRVTVKATQSNSGLNTNVQQVVKAAKLGRLDPNETVFGVQGTEEALAKKLTKEIAYAESQGDMQLANRLRETKDNIKVIEYNTPNGVQEDNVRMMDKIKNGEAVASPTLQQVGEKALQGAVVGAAVSLTVSAITNYVRFKNGQLTAREAFSEISEETIKGALVGGAMGAITIFLPGGAVGFVSGMAIGIYINKICSNILDEIYGKGAYGTILNSSGYVYGMTLNLADQYEKIRKSNNITNANLHKVYDNRKQIDKNFEIFERMKEE